MLAANRPFGGIEKAANELGDNRDPFLQPKNIVRDPNGREGFDIVSSEPATLILRIDELDYGKTRKSGMRLKVTMTIEASDDPAQPAGHRVSYMVMQNSDYWLKDVTRFVAAAMNVRPDAFVESDYDAMVSARQPVTAARRRIRAVVENIKNSTTNKGKDFTRISWSPIEVTDFDAAGKPLRYAEPAVDNVAAFFRDKRNAQRG